jgi:hypothetical protein
VSKRLGDGLDRAEIGHMVKRHAFPAQLSAMAISSLSKFPLLGSQVPVSPPG